MKNLVPRFLAPEVIKAPLDALVDQVVSNRSAPSVGSLLTRSMCHVVILAPAMKDDRETDYVDWPDYPIHPHVVYERSVGDRSAWPYKFSDIARCKALQLWHGRSDGRTDIMPHLVYSGDAPFWGGVRRDGLVVACSGFQDYFDRMLAGIVADATIALAYHAWMTSADKRQDITWLS